MRVVIPAILAGAALVGIWVGPTDVELDEQMVSPVTVYQPATTTSTTVTTTTTTVAEVPTTRVTRPKPATTTTTTWVPDDALCGEWWVVASAVGWPKPIIEQALDELMWRESRCLPDAIGDGSDGLTQIQWSVHRDWITDLGYTRDDMSHPSVNLAVAWHLYQMTDEHDAFRCGLSPWYPSTPPDVDHWCEKIGA